MKSVFVPGNVHIEGKLHNLFEDSENYRSLPFQPVRILNREKLLYYY